MSGAKKMLVGVTETGHRFGEGHHRAKLSDDEVEKIRTLYEETGVGYRKLAKIYNTPRTTIQNIVNHRRRNAYPDRFKKVIECGEKIVFQMKGSQNLCKRATKVV